jgi:hypothetical protein
MVASSTTSSVQQLTVLRHELVNDVQLISHAPPLGHLLRSRTAQSYNKELGGLTWKVADAGRSLHVVRPR